MQSSFFTLHLLLLHLPEFGFLSFPLNLQWWSGAFLSFFNVVYILQWWRRKIAQFTAATRNRRNFFVCSFVRSMVGLFCNTNSIVYLREIHWLIRRKCVCLCVCECPCARKIGRFHYLSTCQGFAVGANFGVEWVWWVAVATNKRMWGWTWNNFDYIIGKIVRKNQPLPSSSPKNGTSTETTFKILEKEENPHLFISW